MDNSAVKFSLEKSEVHNIV